MGQIARAHRDAPLQGNQILVTCRVKDYAEMGQKIPLNGAVTLKPLDDEQMRTYLMEQPELWAAVQADEGLKEMLTTPLLLSFFGFAYRGMTAEERQQLTDLSKSPGDLRDKIFEYYVRERYRHEERKVVRPGEAMPFSLEEVYHILGQVAWFEYSRQDSDNNLPLVYFGNFLDIAQIQLFIELSVRLNLLVSTENRKYKFIHLSLRDYFVYPYAIFCLKSDNARIRQLAAHNLGKLGDTRAVESLVNSLMDVEDHVKASSADALGLLGDIRAVEPLSAMIYENRNSLVVCVSGLFSLMSLGKSGLQQFLGAVTYVHQADMVRILINQLYSLRYNCRRKYSLLSTR